jgi:hypothetical protein
MNVPPALTDTVPFNINTYDLNAELEAAVITLLDAVCIKLAETA